MDELIARKRYRASSIKKRVAFVHVPKTGGTFLHELLAEHFAADRTKVAQHSAFPELGGAISNYNLLTGHFPFRAILQIADDYDLITILRNPLARFYSLLGHHRRELAKGLAAKPTSEEARRTLEIAASDNPASFMNYITEGEAGFNSAVWMLSSLPPEEQDLELHLESAKENLIRSFLFATLPNIERLLLLLQARFSDPNMLFRERRNVSETPQSMPRKLEQELLKRCRYDVALYEFAREREQSRALDEYVRLERTNRNARAAPVTPHRCGVQSDGEAVDADTISIASHVDLVGFHCAEKVSGKTYRYTGPDEISAVFASSEMARYRWFDIRILNSSWPDRTHELSVLVNEESVPVWFDYGEGLLICRCRMPDLIDGSLGKIAILIQTPFVRHLVDANGRMLDERKLGLAIESIKFFQEDPGSVAGAANALLAFATAEPAANAA